MTAQEPDRREIVIRRTRTQFVPPLVLGTGTAGVAGVWLWVAVLSGGGLFVVLGMLMAGWSAFVWLSLIRRPIHMRITPEGVQVYRVLSRPFVRWDALRWARVGPPHRAGILGWREEGDTKDRVVGFNQSMLGPQFADFMWHLHAARPDLPNSAPPSL